MKNLPRTSSRLAFIVLLLSSCGQQNESSEIVASVVTLTVSSNQDILFNGKQTAPEEVGEMLTRLTSTTNTFVVYEIASDAPMATVKEMYRQVANSTVAGVRFASQPVDYSQGARFYSPSLASR